MTESRRIVAVGLLTQADLDLLGQTFDRAYPIEKANCFDELLSAIDQADRRLMSNENGTANQPA